MKKFLSLFTAAALFASVLPAVSFAEGTAPDTAPDTAEVVAADVNEAAAVYSGEYEGVLKIEQYDAKMAQMESAQSDPTVLAKDPNYISLLLQRRLVEKTGYEKLTTAMAADPDLAEAVNRIFSDYELLCYYVYGGEPEANSNRDTKKKPTPDTYLSSFRVFSQLYKDYKRDVTLTSDLTAEETAKIDPSELAAHDANVPVFKRLMTSIALTFSVPVINWINKLNTLRFPIVLSATAMGRYKTYRRFYLKGMLVTEFSSLHMEELRMVVSSPVDDDQLEQMHYYYRVKVLKDNYSDEDGPRRLSIATVGDSIGLMSYAAYNFAPKALGGTGDQFYDPALFDQWNNKYGLEANDDYFKFKVPYGIQGGSTDPRNVAPPLWPQFEVGGVCQQISYLGAVLKNSFGIPSEQLSQVPRHSVFLYQRRTANGTPTWYLGYAITGFGTSSTESFSQIHQPAGWSEYTYGDYYDAPYILMGYDAVMNWHGTDFEKAANLAMMGNIKLKKGDASGALSLFEKALEAQFYNLDAWVGIVDAYKLLGKTDEDYFALARRVAENLKWYPTPMYDFILNYIGPNITDLVRRSDLLRLVEDTLTNYSLNSSKANAESGLVQPNYCVSIAQVVRDRLPKMASFSFNTGKITLNSGYTHMGKDFLYSFDGGTSWNRWTYTEGEASHALTAEEIASITDANDIL